MTERTAAEIAAIDHILAKLGRDIADAARIAESQEAAAEGSLGTSRSMRYYESAEFHRALAALLGDVVEAATAKFSEPTEYPGVPGDGWRDNEGDVWVLCADGEMRLLDSETTAREPWDLDHEYGPMESLIAESDVHVCDNCSGIDPDTCLFNGEKES